MADPYRITLSETDFRNLCAGHVLAWPGPGETLVELTLSDIADVPMVWAVLDGTLPRHTASRGGVTWKCDGAPMCPHPGHCRGLGHCAVRDA